MLNTPPSIPPTSGDDREARIQAMMDQLRPDAEATLRRMAEHLLDLPEDQAFGQIEYQLRDLVHQFAAASQQTALQAAKKRGT